NFRLEKAGATFDQFHEVELLASARGHGLAWARLGTPRKLDVKLPREHVIRGRLIDLQGLPAAGVKGRVVSVSDRAPKRPGGTNPRTRRERRGRGAGGGRPGGAPPGVLHNPGGFDSPHPKPPQGLSAWPAPVTADAQGRFEVRGFGPEMAVHLLITDDRF